MQSDEQSAQPIRTDLVPINIHFTLLIAPENAEQVIEAIRKIVAKTQTEKGHGSGGRKGKNSPAKLMAL